MTRLPGALFVVDIKREHIAIKEAQKLNIPIFAMVDTNSDPRQVDYVIPANDDASKSIDKILTHVTNSISEGLLERKAEKDASVEGDDTVNETATETTEKAPKAKAKKVVVEEDDDTANEAVAKKTKAKTKKVVADEEE
jgi:small subunit ribosomal protein S2